MKKIVAIILAVLMISSLVACSSVGDMNSPDFLDDDKDPVFENNDDDSDESDKTENTNKDEPVTPPLDDKKVIKFVAVGDALIHSAIYREAESIASSKTDYSGNYYFNDMYSGIASYIKDADIAFVNHEAPIANTAITGYPNFNAPSESGDALVDLGFNVINIANNHMFDVDYKVQGYADTIDYWNTKNVLQIGGYKNNIDFDTARVLNVEGVSIAFLAYTDLINGGCYMNKTSERAGYITPLPNDATLVKHINAAKEKADLVFVSMHWGSENVFTTTAEQRRLAQLIADNGADVIIGHHSHTVQPVEWITGKNGNKTLCIYSLGNLISGMLNSKNMVGGLMSFDIVKDDGEITIENPIFNPVVCHYEIANFSLRDPEGNPVRTNFKVYMMEDYTEALTMKHGTQNYGAYNLKTLKGYVTNTVSSEFLPDFLK